MTEDLALTIINIPFETIHLVVIFGVLRIFGFTFSFLAFGWGFGSGVMMRVNLSIVLSFPIMIANFTQTIEIAENTETLELVLLAAKEFAIGFGLGLLASAPFRALQHAGGIIDSFRGESDSGLHAPDNSPLQTLSLLYLVIGFSVFIGSGGLWKLVENLYLTYEIWPIGSRLPLLYEGSAEIALVALSKALELALIIAAPLMILLFTVELVLMVAAKLAKKFGMYDLSFLVKNLLTIVTLPLMAMVILRASEAYTPNAVLSLSIMRTFFE